MSNAVLLALAPVVFVMLLGWGAGRLRIVDNHHVDGLNTLVMGFALPASLFAATASAPRSEMLEQAPLFAVFSAVMLIVYVGWYVVVRATTGVSRADASVQALTIAFPNLAGVGLPIIVALLGPSGTVPLAVALAAGSIVVSPLTLIIVEMSTRKETSAVTPATQVLRAFGRTLTKPIVIAPALGIVLSLCRLEPGPVANACLLLIGHAAPGVALFLTGLVLSAEPFQFDWKVFGATATADLIRPLLAVAVVAVAPVSAEVGKVAILLAAVPSGFFGILFAVNYRLDPGTAGSMVTASTVVSILTMAIAITVLFPR